MRRTWTLSDRGAELSRGVVEWSRSPMNIDCCPETRRREPEPEQLDLFGRSAAKP
jgi:hypothetical protein